MAVYVDNMEARWGRMVMCHMIADSREELDQMADRIGVNRKWIQREGTRFEHYDISRLAKERAIKFGAIEISQRELLRKIKEK